MKKNEFLFSHKLSWYLTAFAFIGCAYMSEICGQMMSMPTFLGDNGKKAKSDRPSVITATTMDFDMEKNVAEFMGNVVVDDQEMTIECDRMRIFMEEKAKDEAPKEGKTAEESAKQKKAEESSQKLSDDVALDDETADIDEEKSEKPSLSGNKKVSRVECIGNVVITRKQDDGSIEGAKEKATAGKVIYYCQTEVIDLLDKPVVYTQDNRVVTGRILTVLLKEGGRIKITLGKIEDYNKTSVRDIGK